MIHVVILNLMLYALEKKNYEYLHKGKIFLDVAHKGALRLPPKYIHLYLLLLEF